MLSKKVDKKTVFNNFSSYRFTIQCQGLTGDLEILVTNNKNNKSDFARSIAEQFKVANKKDGGFELLVLEKDPTLSTKVIAKYKYNNISDLINDIENC